VNSEQAKDSSELPGREYPDRPIASVAACVFKGDTVLLIKRARQPSQGLWSVPGGAIELGETIRDAVKRELYEECGIEIDVDRVINAVDLILPDEKGRIWFHYIVTYLLARHISGEARPGSDALDVRWATHQELDTLNMTPAVRKNMQYSFEMAREAGFFGHLDRSEL
jgi:8-oxo-dGTP diphosphatase